MLEIRSSGDGYILDQIYETNDLNYIIGGGHLLIFLKLTSYYTKSSIPGHSVPPEKKLGEKKSKSQLMKLEEKSVVQQFEAS